MIVGIDTKQASTWRGLVWVIGGLVSMYLLAFKGTEYGAAAMAITGQIAGGLGLLIKD